MFTNPPYTQFKISIFKHYCDCNVKKNHVARTPFPGRRLWHFNRILWSPHNHGQRLTSTKSIVELPSPVPMFYSQPFPVYTIHIYRDKCIYMYTDTLEHAHTHTNTHMHMQKFSLTPRAEAVILSLSQHLLYACVPWSSHGDPLFMCVWFTVTDRWWLQGRWALSHLLLVLKGWMDGGEMGGKCWGRKRRWS